jgi:drug/metabolite transporter (DMT)-like permease
MAGADSQHRLGICLVVAAAVAWSTAAFFTRLLPFDSRTILFWRGLFGGGLIAASLVLTQGKRLNALKREQFPWMLEVSKCAGARDNHQPRRQLRTMFVESSCR